MYYINGTCIITPKLIFEEIEGGARRTLGKQMGLGGRMPLDGATWKKEELIQ